MPRLWSTVMSTHSDLKLSKTRGSLRSITLRAMLLAVLVVQEYVLSGIPQVQLTVILILVIAQFLPYSELIPFLIAYVLLDNLLMGSFSLLYTPTMMLIWPLYGIVARSLRHRPDYASFILVIVFSFVYGWSFLPASIYIMKLDTWTKIWTYMSMDFPAEMMMAVVSIITFQLLYKPLRELLKYLFKRVDPNHHFPDDMSL